MTKGITDKAGSGVKVVTASAEYDLNKQGTQMDNFIASGVDLILLNAADPKAIAPGGQAGAGGRHPGGRGRRRGGRRRRHGA